MKKSNYGMNDPKNEKYGAERLLSAFRESFSYPVNINQQDKPDCVITEANGRVTGIEVTHIANQNLEHYERLRKEWRPRHCDNFGGLMLSHQRLSRGEIRDSARGSKANGPRVYSSEDLFRFWTDTVIRLIEKKGEKFRDYQPVDIKGLCLVDRLELSDERRRKYWVRTEHEVENRLREYSFAYFCIVPPPTLGAVSRVEIMKAL